MIFGLMEKDRRRFERIEGKDALATVDFGGRTLDASVFDVSKKGMRIGLPTDTKFPLKSPKVLVRDSIANTEIAGDVVRAMMREDLTFEIALAFKDAVSENVVAILSNDERSLRMKVVGKTIRLWGNKLSGNGVMELFRILKSLNIEALDVSGIADSDSFGITFLTKLEERGLRIVGPNDKLSQLLSLWKDAGNPR